MNSPKYWQGSSGCRGLESLDALSAPGNIRLFTGNREGRIRIHYCISEPLLLIKMAWRKHVTVAISAKVWESAMDVFLQAKESNSRVYIHCIDGIRLWIGFAYRLIQSTCSSLVRILSQDAKRVPVRKLLCDKLGGLRGPGTKPSRFTFYVSRFSYLDPIADSQSCAFARTWLRCCNHCLVQTVLMSPASENTTTCRVRFVLHCDT